VLDAALLHEVIAGHDPLDSTSIPPPCRPWSRRRGRPTSAGLRIGVVRELTGEGYEPGVEARFREAVEVLEGLGATVVEVSCPYFDYALPAYYLIAPSEASSNLARFDAVRYGLRVGDDGVRGLEEVTRLTRAQGFGAEVKRRIVLGTYALSSGYYDAYYGQAQKVRTLISRDFAAGLRAGRRPGRARPARRSRSASARSSTTRWPCTARTSPASRPTSTAARRCRCRAGCPTGLPGGPAGDGADDARRAALPGRRRVRGRPPRPRPAAVLGVAVVIDLLRVRVERVVPAPPERVFDVLADPRRHREIDGSGTVRDAAVDGPARLSLGAVFGMHMRAGAPYSMTNTVVEFEEGRRIAWQPRPTNAVAAKAIGGRIWRYELEPVDGGTRVRETWDISQERVPPLLLPLRPLTRLSMDRTLARLEERLT
jgi:uncharacterized protein YndB with AHSA1/START domain